MSVGQPERGKTMKLINRKIRKTK